MFMGWIAALANQPEFELLTAERANAPRAIGRDIDLVLRNLLPGSVCERLRSNAELARANVRQRRAERAPR
jgi:hypothetical protein